MDLDPPMKVFFDPKVVAETCDLVRVMCYDLYYFAPHRGDPNLADRPDTQVMGPVSPYPWVRRAVLGWLRHVPREKVIMGLPAYSHDYDLSADGRGRHVAKPIPDALDKKISVQKAWLGYERSFMYFYHDQDRTPHLFYASDEESTKALLELATELDVQGIGFWHFNIVHEATWQVVRNWLNETGHT